jgi:hypothetical protein
MAVSAQDVQAAARRYLAPGLEVPMVVVPQPGAPPIVAAPAPRHLKPDLNRSRTDTIYYPELHHLRFLTT